MVVGSPLLVLLAACQGPNDGRDPDGPERDSAIDVTSVESDADGDGFTRLTDCDDGDAAAHPGAAEVCDGIDNDCNGLVDDDDPGATGQPAWYLDDDGDGVGSSSVAACEQPEETATEGGDCDDADPEVYPGARETCDGLDNDCDGLTDGACVDAPRGDLRSIQAQIAISGPCLDSSPLAVFLGDVNGDGLSDLWTDADCDDENRVLTAPGPFKPEQTYDWEADVLLAGSGGEHVSYAWPVDLEGDGGTEMLAEGYATEEPYPYRAYLFLEPRHGLVTADADLTIDFDVPTDYAGGIVDDFQVEAIPGASGGDIAVSASWYEDYDYCGYGVWLVAATWTGPVSTAAAYDLGPDASLGYPSDCDGGNVLDAGDLDGDGNNELLIAEESVADLYLGPFDAADGYRSPDFRLASFEFDEDYAGPWIRSAPALEDLDGDGTEDLLVVGHWNDDSGAWWGILVVEPESAGLPLATASPLVQTPYDGYMSLRGPVALDANADGFLDFAIGDNNADIVDGDEGRIYLEYGPFEGTRSPGEGDNAVIVGSEYKEYVGYDVAAGDTNGDGFDDLALSTRLSDDDHPGTIWIFLGGP